MRRKYPPITVGAFEKRSRVFERFLDFARNDSKRTLNICVMGG